VPPERAWRGVAVVVTALALASPAIAQPTGQQPSQTLYKLVDKSGNVSYVDKIPKGFDGEVTRIEVDPSTNTQRPTPAPRAPAAGESAPRPDINTQRRALRERLQADIDRAHEKLDAAKKALAEGADPKDGEYQTIQQKFDASAAKAGQAGPRPNCRKQTGADGKSVWNCPTIMPGEVYRDRQRALEEAVKLAESELEIAERAYRRGVD